MIVAMASHLMCAALLGLVAAAPAQRPVDLMTPHTFESKQYGTLPYRLFVPTEASDAKRLPLVLFFHGAGERGADNKAQLRHGVRAFIAEPNQAERPCFVAAPQCPRGVWWNVDLIADFARAMSEHPGVDRNRVYVTGLSMGGFATWHLASRLPELFAAAVPVCGGGETSAAPQLKALPIWAFHGDADRTVPAEQSQKMIEAIRKAGGEPKYTEYAGVGHDSWTRTYADPAMHTWLFAQRRTGAAAVQLRDGDRVVFLGDSITAAGATGKGFIKLIETDLTTRAPKLTVELIGAGISGNRVPDLLARVQRDVLRRQPTVVIVYIGINDVWHSLQDRGTRKEDFEAGLRDLVQQFVQANARTILCTPSVIGEKAAGTNPLDAMLDEYAAITRRVATDAGVAVLDLRQRFLGHLGTHNDSDAEAGVLTADGVHLNAAGNRLVADAMLEALGVGAEAGKK